MQLILRVVNGPSAGRTMVVRQGQVARVGRTEWADFPIRDDRGMSDVHFALESAAGGYLLRDLQSSQGTLVNGQKVTAAAVHTGDEIVAGQTTFAVVIEGEQPGAATGWDQGTTAGTGPDASVSLARTAADCCRHLPISDEARQLLAENQTPEEFLERLVASERFADAILLRAFLLPKPLAVLWGTKSVTEVLGSTLSPPQQAAMEAAENWAAEPNEEHRRAAEAAAENLGDDTPVSWLARAAFWSGGSLAKPGLADVPPPDGLTAQAISAMLLILAPHQTPTQSVDRYRSFLKQGKQLMPAALITASGGPG